MQTGNVMLGKLNVVVAGIKPVIIVLGKMLEQMQTVTLWMLNAVTLNVITALALQMQQKHQQKMLVQMV